MARRSTEVLGVMKLDFTALIAERAYFKAERRGFTPGHEVDDWLAAEREVAELAAAETPAPPKKPRKNGAVKKLK
jgi:DUF2934 family protein